MSASYLQGQSYYNESTMDNWSQFGRHEIPAFPHLSLSTAQTLITQNVWFPISPEAPAFFLSAHGLLLFTICMISCRLAPCPHFSVHPVATRLLEQYFAPIICSNSVLN